MVGKTIQQGKYKIYNKLGNGRSGKVFSAIEVGGSRYVAIKFMEKFEEYDYELNILKIM